MSEEVVQLWMAFCRSTGVDVCEPYQVWYFGNSASMADELAALVLAGRKVATASLLKTNEIKPDDAPIVRGYSVVTDFFGEPKCVVRTTEIEYVRFCDVTAGFAAAEGEGDLSLDYWRQVHRDYFEREAKQYGFVFDDESIVCCERFQLLYRQ